MSLQPPGSGIYHCLLNRAVARTIDSNSCEILPNRCVKTTEMRETREGPDCIASLPCFAHLWIIDASILEYPPICWSRCRKDRLLWFNGPQSPIRRRHWLSPLYVEVPIALRRRQNLLLDQILRC